MKTQKKFNKKQTKTDTQKKTSKKSASYSPPSELNLQIIPWVISLVAVIFFFLMILPSSTGVLGKAYKQFFGSLFSYASWLIPLLIAVRAVFYKKDALSRYPGASWWLSVLFLCIFSTLLSCFAKPEGEFALKEAFAFTMSDTLSLDSIVGNFVANLLVPITGKTLLIILNILALFIIAPFLAAKTPLDILQFIARSIRDKHRMSKEKKVSRNEYFDKKEKEEREKKDKETKPAEKPRRDKIELTQMTIEEYPELEEDEPEENKKEDITDTEIYEAPVENKTRLEKIFEEDEFSSISPNPEEETDVITEADTDIFDDELDEDKEIIDFEEPDAPKPEYKFPPIELLKRGEGVSPALSQEYETTAKKLVETLSSFGVRTKILNIAKGPTVTRYELQPEVGVRVRSIRNLSDDISLSLASKGVRIEAPIPGKEAVGIEVPNKNTSTVNIRELVENKNFSEAKSKLTSCLGVDVAGNPVFCDIAKMPHLLIAGTTGSGKSVCINSFLVSMLYKATPDEVKFILIDPKKIELGVYNGIPHLLVPVVSDPKKAAGALAWAVGEMERRFALIEEVGVRDIRSYNEVAKTEPEREALPRIVIVIDELADLMMMARDNVESSICRIAQKARAAGMHLIIGTQRPSVDVITGLIKANVPSRIAFTVASQVDSKTILDVAGAEKLVGKGDMLYAPVGAMTPTRVQGSFVSDAEIEAIIEFLKETGSSTYSDEVIEGIEREAERCVDKGRSKMADDEEEDDSELSLTSDPMLKPAIEIALDSGTISTSMLQRRLKLGYARAARLIDKMEALGIVSEFAGSKPRSVLISRERYIEMLTTTEE